MASHENHSTLTDGTAWQRVIQGGLPGVVWAVDRELRVRHFMSDVLPAAVAGTDYSPGPPLTELLNIPPDAALLDAHRRAFDGSAQIVSVAIGQRTLRGIVSPLRCDGETIGCILSALDQDIVDSKCQSIAAAALELILFLDRDGIIQEVNRVAGHAEPSQVIGKPVMGFAPAHQREQLREALDAVLETGVPTSIELEFANAAGQSRWHALRIGPWRVAEQIVGLVVMATDVTQRRSTLQRLLDEEKLLRQMLDLQERERRLVAYEIHDGFIQDVIGARMLLEAAREQADQPMSALRPRMDNAIQMLAQAIGEGRRLISELRPMIIDEMGLVESLRFLIEEETARGNLAIKLIPRVTTEKLQPLLQASVFRIAREAVTNAWRHGRAAHVEIRLTEVAEQLILEIQDDGRGFDPTEIPPNRYGLEGIRERAKLFGGGATIESRPGHGTRITVKLPTELTQPLQTTDTTQWCWTV